MYEDKSTILINVESDKVGKYAPANSSKTSGVYKPDYMNM
jgi:hypothetical protein